MAAFRIMRYALGPLRQPGGRLAVELDDPAPPGTGVEIPAPVVGHLELAHGGSSLSVRGHLRVVVRQDCSRCLGTYDQILEMAVNEECAPVEIDTPEAALEAAGRSGQIPCLNEGDLDLSELVRQVIAMNLPTRPLCAEDCAGLCPGCGHDLNQGPCQCADDDIDPRWQALKNLKT